MDNDLHETKALIVRGFSIEELRNVDSSCEGSLTSDCSTVLLERHAPQSSNDETLTDEPRTLYQYLRHEPGPSHLLVLCMAYALAIGATIGVVPSVMTDAYARLNHGYHETVSCASYPFQNKPTACIQGSNDAQTANTIASFTSNGLTFLTSSLIGSYSDEIGRRSKYWLPSFHGVLYNKRI